MYSSNNHLQENGMINIMTQELSIKANPKPQSTKETQVISRLSITYSNHFILILITFHMKSAYICRCEYELTKPYLA